METNTLSPMDNVKSTVTRFLNQYAPGYTVTDFLGFTEKTNYQWWIHGKISGQPWGVTVLVPLGLNPYSPEIKQKICGLALKDINVARSFIKDEPVTKPQEEPQPVLALTENDLF